MSREEIDNNPYTNPMIKAIDENNVEALKSLLEKGEKPDLKYAFTEFGANKTDPKILDLLVEYNALPENLSLSTLKLILFAKGNQKIAASEFIDKPDLNLNGWPEKSSPIALFAQSGNVAGVGYLIQNGVKKRPINCLFLLDIHPSHFMGCDLLHIDTFKKQISDIFSGNLACRGLEEKCKVGALLLLNPTEELDTLFENEKELLRHELRFLPLFAWTAKNNIADLLEAPYFEKLFKMDKNSAKEAMIIAAAFGSKDFLTKAIEKGLLEQEDIGKVCSIAAANADNILLSSLSAHLKLIEKHKASAQTTRKVSGIYFIEHFGKPLFWAIRNSHKSTVELLLNEGCNPNKQNDEFSRDSNLQLAIRCANGDTDIIEMLLSHDAEINHKDELGETALHEAASRNDLKILKILIAAKADINLADGEGRKPLDLIQDMSVRSEIEEFIHHLGTKKPGENKSKEGNSLNQQSFFAHQDGSNNESDENAEQRDAGCVIS